MDERVRRIDSGLRAGWQAQVLATGRGLVAERDGLLLALSGVADETLNPGLVVREPVDPVAALAWSTSVRRAHGVPGDGFDVAEGAHPVFERAMTAAGYRELVRRPGCAAAVKSVAVPASGDLQVDVVGDAAGLAAYRAVQVEVFGWTPETAAQWVTAPLVADPAMALLVGRVGGEIVGAAAGSLHQGAVGVFGVCVTEGRRRRGYGAALTAAVVTWGAERGADLAWLQASELGLPVYLAMGFEVVRDYVVWTTPSP